MISALFAKKAPIFLQNPAKTTVGAVKTFIGAVKTNVGAVKTNVGAVKTFNGAVKTFSGGVKKTVASFYHNRDVGVSCDLGKWMKWVHSEFCY